VKGSPKKKIFNLNSSQPKNNKISDVLGPPIGAIGKNERISNASVRKVHRNPLRGQQDFSPNTTLKTHSNSTTKANLFMRMGGKGENFTQKYNQTVYDMNKKLEAVESWSATHYTKNLGDPSFEPDRPKLEYGFPEKFKTRNKMVDR
jgi:hypothetical protein